MAKSEQDIQDEKDFQDEFNKDDGGKSVDVDDDEVVSDGDQEPAEESEVGVEEAEESPEVAVEPPADVAQAAPESQMTEQQLKSWEGRLKAKEAELSDREANSVTREASSDTTNSGEAESIADADSNSDTDDSDPEKALSDDFGSDFVSQMKRLIEKVAGSGGAQSPMDNGLEQTVNSLIEELRNERQQNHFNSIKEAHEDFLEVVSTPEFEQWKNASADLPDVERVIESGSSKEIIALLTAFKNSASESSEQSQDGDDDYESLVNNAEGVRSRGGNISLPSKPAASQEYLTAWDEA